MQSTAPAAEYRIGKAIVRMHGTPDREKLEEATLKFMRQVEMRKRQQKKEEQKK